MKSPRLARHPIYTVCDAKQPLGEDDEDRETDLGGSLRGDSGGDREADLGEPLRRERGGDSEADIEGPPPLRRRRVVAVILPAAAACVVLALVLLRPVSGQERPHAGSAEGASRLPETNVPATSTGTGPTTPIGRARRISRHAPARRSASVAHAVARKAPRRSGRAIEAPQPVVALGPVVFADGARPTGSLPHAVADVEFGFER